MQPPWYFKAIRIGESDVTALVMSEVEVILPERVLDPVRHPDERWAVDVVTNPIVHVWVDDRVVREPMNVHGLLDSSFK